VGGDARVAMAVDTVRRAIAHCGHVEVVLSTPAVRMMAKRASPWQAL
jgi:hypothetical protein